MNEKAILDLVAAIGASEDIGEIRRIVLEMIRRNIWFDTANFWIYPPMLSDPQESLVFLDSPYSTLDSYFQHYIDMDEFHQTYNRNNLLIARSTDLMDYSRWTRQSEYYNDFLKHNNVHYILGFDIKDDFLAYGALCLHRENNIGDFNEKDLLYLHMLYPHLVNRLRWVYENQVLLSRLNACGTQKSESLTQYFNMLTVRERKIVQQVLSGKSNRETAENLGISTNTVKMHLQNVFMKLGIKRRSQLFSFYSVKDRNYFGK